MSEDQQTRKKFYLTTPIYYVNARPHIGHAYTTIVADVIARRHRLLGDNTYFLTGTDEHGQKIERSAAAAGIPPQQFADQVSASFENLWKRMGITHDQFIRTTSEKHKRGVQKLFTTLQSLDKIYLSSYTGQYSIGEEMFVEGPPGTIGPDGKPTETVTEENYFFRLSEYQLPLLNLIESGQLSIQPEVRKNEVLSFLRGNVSEKESVILSGAPERAVGESNGAESKDLRLSSAGIPYVPGALKDLSISRSSFKWGVPVPETPGLPGPTASHVIYVWLDALANYMTAVGYGSDDPIDIAQFNKYWPANLHLVGKEIIRFHCVYWPAFLLALNPATKGKKPEEVPFEVHSEWAKKMLPKAITAHGWLLFQDSNNEASKMSKSKGNIVRTETILDAFGTLLTPLSSRSAAEGPASPELPQPPAKAEQDLFAADVLRYFLLREIPFGQDGSFSFDALVTRYNADLANGYGNLVSRTLKLVQQNMPDGWILPEKPWLYPTMAENTNSPEEDTGSSAVLWDLSCDLVDITHEVWWPRLAFNDALADIMAHVSRVDEYLSFHKPWVLAKKDDPHSRRLLIEVLHTASEAIRTITIALYPFLPFATANVWRQLGLGEIADAVQDWAKLGIGTSEDPSCEGKLISLQWGGLKPGTKLGPLAPIFPRAPKELIQQMTDMENPVPAPTPSKLVDETTTHTTHVEQDPTHPAAPPRAFSPEGAAPTVAGSYAITTERPGTPTHTEAQASGVFAHSSQLRADSSTLNASPASSQPTPQIAIDDFVKIDLRVARIIVAERIPKADKLLRLEVDLGYEKRQILSGIAEWYTPEELIGRRIVIIANLAPRKMRGLESHGMLLAASDGDNGKPILATFGEEIALGSRLK